MKWKDLGNWLIAGTPLNLPQGTKNEKTEKQIEEESTGLET